MQLFECEEDAKAEKTLWWFVGRRALFRAMDSRLGLKPSDPIADIGTSARAKVAKLVCDGSHSHVLATGVHAHIEDDQKAASEIFRAPAPGGWGIFTVPTVNSLEKPGQVRSGHLRRCTLTPREAILKYAGVEIVQRFYFNSLLCPLICAIRNFIRHFNIEVRTESGIPPWPINQLLTRLFLFDVMMAPRLQVPFGVSALILARKRESS